MVARKSLVEIQRIRRARLASKIRRTCTLFGCKIDQPLETRFEQRPESKGVLDIGIFGITTQTSRTCYPRSYPRLLLYMPLRS